MPHKGTAYAAAIVAFRYLALILVLAVATHGFGQELRAWQDIDFGDSPEVVQTKMVGLQNRGVIRPPGQWAHQQYAEIARFPETSWYPLELAGVATTLRFHFNDGKLYRLQFVTDNVNASLWEAQTLLEYRHLLDVLTSALGMPDRAWNVRFLDMVNGYVRHGATWESSGVSHWLGIGERGSTFYVALDVQWDWMVRFIAEEEERQRNQSVRDAADGF